MTRWLLAAAVASLIVSGLVLNARQETDGEPALIPTPTATATATASPTSTPAVAPAARAAEAYTLATTSWSPGTYVNSYRQRLALAASPLREGLRRERPTPAQLRQLRADRLSRLGAVLSTRLVPLSPKAAEVVIAVDEVQLAAGQRTQRTIRYRLHLRKLVGAWRVIAFTAIGESS